MGEGRQESLLRRGIEALGLYPSIAGSIPALEAFLEELELWNKRRDLVNASGEVLVVKHVLDSLAGLPYLAALPHATIVDVGSGAGFPGIPIALCLADSEVTLVERSTKRATFLRNVVLLLDLKDRVEVIERDLGRIRERFSVVTFRAFRDLKSFAPSLFGLAEEGGRVVAYKGRRSVAERELVEIGELVAESEVHSVEVPGLEEERTIVVLRPKRAG